MRSGEAHLKIILRNVKGYYRMAFRPKKLKFQFVDGWGFPDCMVYMGLYEFLALSSYNGKLRKPIIKCHCDENLV